MQAVNSNFEKQRTFLKGTILKIKEILPKINGFMRKIKLFIKIKKAFLDGYKYRFYTQISLFQRKSKV